jgi:hypothetical protein
MKTKGKEKGKDGGPSFIDTGTRSMESTLLIN